MKLNPEMILNEAYVGKVIKSFEFGIEDNPVKEWSIGKKILKVRFGFNDSREDSGMIVYVEGVGDPVFVYSNEKIEIE